MSYTPLVDPIFTGNPRVPTAAPGDNDTTAASTAFVTDAVSTAGASFVTLSGSQTISGAKTFSSDITLSGATTDLVLADGGQVAWSDVSISRTAANIISISAGDKFQQSATPTTGNDLTNKTYVDAVATGLDWKASVRAATTANITLSGAQTIDDVSVIAGDRVLVKNQTTASENGIYVAASGAWSRSTDADADAEVTAGLATFVTEGTANGDKGWVLTTNDPIVVGTTALSFSQFSSLTPITTLDSLTDVDTSGVVDGALLRYESSGTQWNDTVSLLYSDAGQLQNTTTGSAGGILLGGDAQWYRSAADTMRTPDALVVDGVTTLTGLATLTAGSTTASGNYTTTTSGGFVASGTGAVSTNSGNISSTSGNLVITAGTALIGGKLTHEAGLNVKTATKTANYTVDLSLDYVIFCDSSGGAFTVTLPASHSEGDTVVIKDVAGTAGTNNVTIDPADADTIDGQASFLLTVNYQGATVCSNGTNWFVI